MHADACAFSAFLSSMSHTIALPTPSAADALVAALAKAQASVGTIDDCTLDAATYVTFCASFVLYLQTLSAENVERYDREGGCEDDDASPAAEHRRSSALHCFTDALLQRVSPRVQQHAHML